MEGNIRHANPCSSTLNMHSYLDQGWFQHGESGEVDLNAGPAQYMLPSWAGFMALVVMRSKDDVRDLQLMYGALHLQS
jgi:hypothetical protein